MTRTHCVAIAGIENSHAWEIVRYLNVDRPAGVPVRVTALVAGEREHTAELAELGGIETIVDSAIELRDRIDALIVTSRDGALHRDLAVPFLEVGIPVWVDKPLAANVADADDILFAAERGGAALTSSSALRWVPDTRELAESLGEVGELQTLTLTGPADPDSEYSGIFFYGIHLADVAQRLLPGLPTDIDIRTTQNAIVARYRVAGILVTLEFVRPDSDGRVPFRATVAGRHGVIGREIHLSENYVQPGVNAFAEMLESGMPPIPAEQMRAPIELLQAIRNGIGGESGMPAH